MRRHDMHRWPLHDRKQLHVLEVDFAFRSLTQSSIGVCVECICVRLVDPLNLYALSNLAFDNHVRSVAARYQSTVAGLRYFNVYGPRESRKGKMASMVYQLYRQLKTSGRARLFEGTDGYADGEQRRDFVFVNDIVRVNLALAEGPVRNGGVYNVGTGQARSFNDVARILITRLGAGAIDYVPFPKSLTGKYQSFTQAELSSLRAAGYTESFSTLESGIAQSVDAWDRE